MARMSVALTMEELRVLWQSLDETIQFQGMRDEPGRGREFYDMRRKVETWQNEGPDD